MSVDMHDLLMDLPLWMGAVIAMSTALSKVLMYQYQVNKRVQRRVGFATKKVFNGGDKYPRKIKTQY